MGWTHRCAWIVASAFDAIKKGRTRRPFCFRFRGSFTRAAGVEGVDRGERQSASSRRRDKGFDPGLREGSRSQRRALGAEGIDPGLRNTYRSGSNHKINLKGSRSRHGNRGIVLSPHTREGSPHRRHAFPTLSDTLRTLTIDIYSTISTTLRA